MTIPSTMPEQVSLAKDLEISYRTLHPCAIMADTNSGRSIKIPFSSITNKYKDFLSTIVIMVELDEELQNRYLYKPKLLSQDLYNTTELWNDMLILNNATSVIQFKPKMAKVYDPSKLKLALNQILILEDQLDNIDY